MLRYKNWMTYSYDDGPLYGPKTHKNALFKLHFGKNIEIKNLNYFEALENNARTVAEDFTGPFDILFSGGIDSEIIVRMNHKLGIKQNVYTFRLENNINARDVYWAKKTCDDIGIKLNLIDFNLQKWIENDAYAVYQKTNAHRVERLVRLEWFKYFDNIIVTGEGEPYWRREIAPDYSIDPPDALPDYSVKSEWKLLWEEDQFLSSKYGKLIGQTVIGEWYNYTPEVVKSYHKLPIIKKLLDDKIPGKISCWSSRTEIHREIFPTISNKPKLVGYEGLDGKPSSLPDFLVKFQNEIMGDSTNAKFKFTVEELDNLLL